MVHQRAPSDRRLHEVSVPEKTQSTTRAHMDLNDSVGRIESKLFRSPSKDTGANQPQQINGCHFHWSPKSALDPNSLFLYAFCDDETRSTRVFYEDEQGHTRLFSAIFGSPGHIVYLRAIFDAHSERDRPLSRLPN